MSGYAEFYISVDEDGSCELTMEFNINNFSGKGSAYFSTEILIKEIEKFTHYPIQENAHPYINGGYWDVNEPTKLAQEHLYMSLSPLDLRGNLILSLRVAEPKNDWQIGLLYTAAVEFNTTYEQINQFCKDINSLIRGDASKVIFKEIK